MPGIKSEIAEEEEMEVDPASEEEDMDAMEVDATPFQVKEVSLDVRDTIKEGTKDKLKNTGISESKLSEHLFTGKVMISGLFQDRKGMKEGVEEPFLSRWKTLDEFLQSNQEAEFIRKVDGRPDVVESAESRIEKDQHRPIGVRKTLHKKTIEMVVDTIFLN
uniref:DEK_C domain-containing protein n=1 Tax=Rhabditophanes sp. KR3021 TaxID=114890 RepID=A0AC35UFM6_9BILA